MAQRKKRSNNTLIHPDSGIAGVFLVGFAAIMLVIIGAAIIS